MRKRNWFVTLMICALSGAAMAQGNTRTIVADSLIDKIRGGLLGQIIGNLNGLPHEGKYIAEPGKVEEFTPSLPNGAWTDDDTDFEWVYIYQMQKNNTLLLPYADIAKMWKKSVNKRIWCANQYARYLMDLGMEPPLTGSEVFNPWSGFNISGQFLCETYGLIAPGMPVTASNIGLHYTRVAISGEPAQTTQMFCSMISYAFFESDINKIIEAGIRTLDKKSELHQIINDVKIWYHQYPDDWSKTRKLIHDKYTQESDNYRDFNGHELNTACIIAALLYGKGDFVTTAKTAFNLGWDADCNAATALTILGVINGYKWMMSQGWQIMDRYANTTREGMPLDETITTFADRIAELAEKAIVENNGKVIYTNGKKNFEIDFQEPKQIVSLASVEDEKENLKSTYKNDIINDIKTSKDRTKKAKAAYMAICLGLANEIKSADTKKWSEAVYDLNGYWRLMQRIYHQEDITANVAFRKQFSIPEMRIPEPMTMGILWAGGTEWKKPEEMAEKRIAVNDWYLIGPFEFGLDKQNKPEVTQNMAEKHIGKNNISLSWVNNNGTDCRSIENIFPGNDSAVFYAITWIHSPAKLHTKLYAASDDGVKIWLNDQLVHKIDTVRGILIDEDEINISLNKGWNKVLVKLQDIKAGSGFVIRTGKDQGLKISSKREL